MGVSGSTVTILFTDLVNSTELLQRAGDEDAQRIFQAHQKLLRDAVASHGGEEVKWLGDGLMVAFASAADAVRCAIAMQQAARRPARGERLRVRVGLNAGEALRDEEDYFGTAVVVAKRLCDRAESGQVLCSALVAGLLHGRQAFEFRELGALDLKGITAPVAACDVVYERDEPGAFLSHTPFVGRETETARLRMRLSEARAGRGGLVMLVGEPGIGKTRTAEEFAEHARNEGATVLWGRCYDGEWAPPYGPFAEAIAEYVRTADQDALRADLGYGGPPIARLVNGLREKLPEIEEPAPLQPDEERFRLLDAVSQFLIATSQRTALVLVLDDLHWTDKSTIAMLRHVARFAKQNNILLVGAYRDVELARQHPLAEALGTLRRETEYERLPLKGLDIEEVGELCATAVEQDAPPALVEAVSAETEGNPFFVREVLLHLVETEALYQKDGRWTSDVSNVVELGIPEGVRQVIGQRLSRLSETANALLCAASAFDGAFRFDTVARVAQIDEQDALDAIDQALAAQVLQPGVSTDTCDFTHALFRHTLYTGLSPPRQVRLHRQIADALAGAHDANDHAAEIAYHYHRSATLPGAAGGVEYAIAAADKAEAAYAHEDVASFLRMALELMPEGDARRGRVMGRMAIARAWSLEFELAVTIAIEASVWIAAVEGNDAAADLLADAALEMRSAGYPLGVDALADQGLVYLDERRRDRTWASLMVHKFARQQVRSPEYLGIPVDFPERTEIDRVVAGLPVDQRRWFDPPVPLCREDVLTHAREAPFELAFKAGEYRRTLAFYGREVDETERRGQISHAVLACAHLARVQLAVGNISAARDAYRRGRGLAVRIPDFAASPAGFQLAGARSDRRLVLDEGWDAGVAEAVGALGDPARAWLWALAIIRAVAAYGCARLGQEQDSLRLLNDLIDPIERAPAWSDNYPALVCLAAGTVWLLGRTDNSAVIERNVVEKMIRPDFRYANVDGRLAMAQLCALQGRHTEAIDWFAKARVVLEEQGARPLRAIVDHDEALMYVRRGRKGDRGRAAPLLDAALSQFREIGMTGWVRRAEELRQQIEQGGAVAVHPDGLTPREVDVLRLIAAGRTNTEIASELTLSVRTVARHITNIYTKIGARNKVEATDYATRNGLK